MFTGIIEEIGTIKAVKRQPKSVQLTISGSTVLEGTKIGDSIATSGVCLTVTKMASHQFDVDVMYETLNKTAIKHVQVGDQVNLERALTPSTRMGGHIVSGHIDGVGRIMDVKQEGIATVYRISAPTNVLRYIITKGSIAIDGISLTVVDVSSSDFRVSLIPHTKSETTLSKKRGGDVVNLECDIVGKYIEKFTTSSSGGITMEVLKEYGYN